MRSTIEFYCNYCKAINKMVISGPVKNMGVYWLKCTRCKNNWRVPIEEVERLAK